MAVEDQLGWQLDCPSPLDYTLSTPQIAELLEQTKLKYLLDETSPMPPLPSKVDLRATGCFSPVEDQGQLGSCTANAAIGLMEYFEIKTGGNYTDASRLFIYKVARKLGGLTGDSGAQIRNVMGALALFGAPPERFFPYDITKFDEEPPAFCYSFAANFKALKYFRINESSRSLDAHDKPIALVEKRTVLLNRIKAFIAAEYPCIFGFSVFRPEISKAKSNGGLIAFPGKSSRLAGGHAVVACGYDDDLMINGEKGALLIRNSWGSFDASGNPIGEEGYFWLSYSYVLEGLATNWWTIIKQEWVDSEQFI